MLSLASRRSGHGARNAMAYVNLMPQGPTALNAASPSLSLAHGSVKRSQPAFVTSLLSPILPSFTLPRRHGSSSSQSSRASSASYRASGSSYRKPKGRVFVGLDPHRERMKEDKPVIPNFAPPPLPKNQERAKRQRARAAKMKNQADSTIMLAHDQATKPKHRSKRMKTPLHKDAAIMEMQWAEEEQRAAEEDARRFIEQGGEDEYDDVGEFDAEDDVEDGNGAADYSPTSPPLPPPPPKPLSHFGIQVLLRFLREHGISVQVAAKAKRRTKKTSTAESIDSSTQLPSDTSPTVSAIEPDAPSTPPISTNPLDQDLIVYDVASRFHFSDFIVVVKTQSARQMRFLAESTYKMARELNACASNPKVLSLEGRGRSDWMLVDAGHIWVYFFNRTPAVSLPKALKDMFGVNALPRKGDEWMDDHALGGRRKRKNEMPLPYQQQQLASGVSIPFMLDQTTNSVEFLAPAQGNIFNPQNLPLEPSAYEYGSDDGDANSFYSPNPPDSDSSSIASSSSSSLPTSVPVGTEGLLEQRPTTSTQINSASWFEATPDRPKQSAALDADEHGIGQSDGKMMSRKQMRKMKDEMAAAAVELSPTGNLRQGQSSAHPSSNIIDAQYSATSEPLTSSFSSSSTVDPALNLLYSSNFTHPVLENLERNYADLRVATAKLAKIKDYPHPGTMAGEEEEAERKRNASDKQKTKRKSKKSGARKSIEVQDAGATVPSNAAHDFA